MKTITKLYGVQETFRTEGYTSKPKIIGPTFESVPLAEEWIATRFSKGWKTEMKVITIHRITDV